MPTSEAIRQHGDLTVAAFVCNPFSTNCYVVHTGSEAVLVDASPYSPSEIDAVVSYIEDAGVDVVRALLTHGHIDHILGCGPLADRLGVTWEIHAADMALYQHAPDQAAMFGVPFGGLPPARATLDEAGSVSFGGIRWAIRHTPGHSPGSVSFVDEGSAVVFSGDVLFRGSVGRTDLWEGSFPTLIRSIREALLVLDDDVTVYSGHGPATTVGYERATNPFLAAEVEG